MSAGREALSEEEIWEVRFNMRPFEDQLGRLFQAVGAACAKAAGNIPACLRNRKTGVKKKKKKDRCCQNAGSVVGDKVKRVDKSQDLRVLFLREHFHHDSGAHHSLLSSPRPLGSGLMTWPFYGTVQPWDCEPTY